MINLKTDSFVEISAKIFRVKREKPKYLPRFLWAIAKKRRWRIAGRWEDKGVITTNETVK
jgi:hypothetical protein